MGKLDGKIALITGGSDGIGLATAQQFIIEGAEHVFITGRRQKVLDEAVKTIASKNVTGVQSDASNMADLDRLFNLIQKEKGRLDILFANAGLGEAAQLGSITEEFFDKIFNLNVRGLLFTVQKSLPIFATIQGIPTNSVYSASKAAVRSFARCWTVDLKERHIRVNVVSPGIIGTSSIRQATNNEQGKAIISAIVAATPLNRLGTPDEVAKAVVFLASDDSSYITGIELFVDGGSAQI